MDLTPPSLTGLPMSDTVEFQCAFVASVTCPACGRLSAQIQHAQIPVPDGMAVAPFCVCPNGHSWPHISVYPGSSDPDD